MTGGRNRCVVNTIYDCTVSTPQRTEIYNQPLLTTYILSREIPILVPFYHSRYYHLPTQNQSNSHTIFSNHDSHHSHNQRAPPHSNPLHSSSAIRHASALSARRPSQERPTHTGGVHTFAALPEVGIGSEGYICALIQMAVSWCSTTIPATTLN
jgi:hypothetical protein